MEVDNPDHEFDLEAYANNYSGHGKVNRLLFIAKTTNDTALGLEALRLAADEVKQGQNTGLYKEIADAIHGRLGPKYELDKEWVESTQKAVLRRQESLDKELNGYKTNLIKESIRLGHNELGNHYYASGRLSEAFKCYVRTRDYCTTSKHHWQACLNAIRVSIELGQFPHVNNYISKAELLPDIKGQPDVIARLAAAGGLSALEGKRYKTAARKFTEVNAELGSQWNNVIAPQDIALYGVLCGLAYFERKELREHIIDNVQFREYLEVYPEVREIVGDFYDSKYASCLQQLERLKPTLQLDLYISHHASDLLNAVRSKALVQYTAPFVTVHLPTMATAFNIDCKELEQQIAELIQAGQIQARIDSDSQVLHKRRTNTRSTVFAEALQASEEFLTESRALLLRANLQRHDLMQKAAPGRRNKGGGGEGAINTFIPVSGNAPWSADREGPLGSFDGLD